MSLIYDMFSAIVQNYIVPEIQDNVYVSNVLFLRLKDAAKIYEVSNDTVQVPLLNKKDVAAGTYTRFGALDTTPTEPWTAAIFRMGHYYCHIPLAVQDIAKLRGDRAVVDYVKARKASAELKLFDLLGTHLYSGDGTDPEAIVGMKNLISTTSSYGGIAVADFAEWVAGYIDNTAYDLSTFTLQKFFDAVENLTIGSDRPTIAITSRKVYSKIRGLIQTNQRYNGEGDSVKVGQWKGIEIDDVSIFPDQHLETGLFNSSKDSIIFLNERYLGFHVQANFNMNSETLPLAQEKDVYNIRVRIFPQLVCKQRRMQGAITNINPAT